MTERGSRAAPDTGRVKFGVPGLDAMLDGGLMPHRPYLLVGPAGTGKTTLALQFLCEGLRHGEPALYVTLEDPPNEVRINHRTIGPELQRIDVFDAIPDVMRYERIPFKDISSVRDVVPFTLVPEDIRRTPEFTSVEVTIAALEQLLRTQTVRRGYRRMVIDSLTALQYFCMKGLDSMTGAQTFMRFLSDLGATTLLTVESPLEEVDTPERMLARGEIRLFRWEREGKTARAIGVEKFRGSAHDARMHPYRLGPKGLDINLEVSIARDTREVAQPPVVVVAPEAVAAGLVRADEAEPISQAVQDLVALGIDPSPLREEVEVALAQVRAGRTDRSAAHIARMASLSGVLAQTALEAPGAAEAASRRNAAAFRRVGERADRAREGQPPLRLPVSSVLRSELEQILALLPEPTAAAQPAARPPPSAPPTDLTGFDAELSVPPYSPPPPPSVEGDDSAGTVGPEPEARPPHPAIVHDATPTRRAAPSSPGRSLAEPPPLPRPTPGFPASPGPAASDRTTPRRSATGPRPTAEFAPPLPAPLPPPSMVEPALLERSPEAKPAPRRRRKPTGKAATRDANTGAGSDGGPALSGTKPRKRVVRRRKAPPVVAATAEPLPPAGETAQPEPPPPPTVAAPPAESQP